MEIRFDNQVAIVTGAGNGLGRSHALALAERGANVVVNDLGASRDGSGGSSEAALEVVKLIKERGGNAIANGANIAKFDEVKLMVDQAMEAWGRVDILINNAGILRDKSFAKMNLNDFDIVMDVHLKGSVNCTKAVWEIMREQEYGRIVMTTSSSGLYGNFGQSNYGAAKMAVVGFMNTLVLEGQKYGIKVNALAPAAATRMTTDLGIDEDALNLMTPEAVTAGLLTLCHKDSPNRLILCAGAGGYASTQIYETEGIILPPDEQTPEAIMAQLDGVTDSAGQKVYQSGAAQSEKFVKKAMALLESPKRRKTNLSKQNNAQ